MRNDSNVLVVYAGSEKKRNSSFSRLNSNKLEIMQNNE